MFTGIVEDIGCIKDIARSRLTIRTRLSGVSAGDSIAVNGICLTVTGIGGGKEPLLSFDFSPETASRTTLGRMSAGERVNVERALKAGDRIGGHFLTGHIEGIGEIISSEPQGNARLFTFSLPPGLCRYVIPKGSVGVDGISLTVTDVGRSRFSAAVIPHTLRHTTLGDKKPGAPVNLEPDILAKYVENSRVLRERPQTITRDFLKENGFM